MELWLIIILLAILGGGGTFIFFMLSKKRKGDEIDTSIYANDVHCKVKGSKGMFHISFDSESVSFLVEEGVITGFKTKGSTSYIRYERGVRNV